MSENGNTGSRPPSVRALGTPSRGEIDALAEIFDRYRGHYGETAATLRSASWLDENLGDNDPALRLYADSGYAPIEGHSSLMLPLETGART